MNILDSLHQDHVHMAELLDLLEVQLERLRHPEGEQQADISLMSSIARYFVSYPEVTHHPTEDQLFRELAGDNLEFSEQVKQLQSDHAVLKKLGQEFENLTDDVVSGDVVGREDIVHATENFLARQREHMNLEETAVLPAAAERLDGAAIAAVETAYYDSIDPLFGDQVDEHYAKLREAIVARGDG